MPAAFMNSAVGRCRAPYRPDELKITLVRPLLGVVDQLLERLVGLLVVDDQHHRAFGEARDRDEVGARELGRAAEQLVDLGETRDRDDVHEQRVAVGLGGGGELGADLAGGAGLGLDHHRLLEERLEHGGERPADHVGGAARRKRIDERDRARGIGLLRQRRRRCERRGGCGRADDESASVHAYPPYGEVGIHCAIRPARHRSGAAPWGQPSGEMLRHGTLMPSSTSISAALISAWRSILPVPVLGSSSR